MNSSNGGRNDFPVFLPSPGPLPRGEETKEEVISATVATAEPLGILIVSHGSPREDANRRFVAMVERVASRLSGPAVRAAFLTVAEFSIPRQVAELAEQGVRRIVVMPYFLVAGRHVTQDIPALLEHCHQTHPHVTLELLPTLEDDPALEDLLVHRLQPPA